MTGQPETERPAITPATPDAALELFGDRITRAERYVAILADTGISHGLVGPREAPRLWDRHVLNCAVVHPLFDEGAEVADVGSGAGLPGIVLAIIRPDLRLYLIEPLKRRTVWLRRTVEELELANVTVHEGRAESLWGVRRFPYVTARAVARTGELARWTLPLLTQGGSLRALKGSRAREELELDRESMVALGATAFDVTTHGAGVVDPPTVVLSVSVSAAVPGRRAPGRRAGRTSPKRGRTDRHDRDQ